MLTRTDLETMLRQDGDRRPIALIIGAGLGGLAAAVRLGAKGYRAVVLDRLDSPGGRGTARRQGGYRFDLGPTIVTVPQVFEELWAVAGRDFHEEIDLRHLDPYYTITFPDGSDFTVSSDPALMREEVRKLSPGDVAGFDRFMDDSERRYRFGFENLGRRPLHQLWELIKVLPIFGYYRADRSIYRHAALRMKDERLRMAFSFHPLFIGGDPFHVTSMYALVSHLEKAFGVHYAMGGVAAIAEGMARIVADQGGLIRYGVDVDEILVKDGRARGVKLESGETVSADIVVSNADAGHTYSHLLRKRRQKRWTDAKLDRARWSMSLFVWYFGTKGTRDMWSDIGHHTIVNGPRYRGLVNDIFIKGRLAEDMSLYVHRPSVTDPTCAPEGDDTFYVLSPVPHLGFSNPVDWEAELEPYRQKVAVEVEKILPGFEPRIAESHIMTPHDFRDRYRSPHGAGFSLEPRILQSAWFRPHNISEDVRGLYLVGAGTHPGAGLPGVVSSAEVLDKLVPEAVHAR